MIKKLGVFGRVSKYKIKCLCNIIIILVAKSKIKEILNYPASQPSAHILCAALSVSDYAIVLP